MNPLLILGLSGAAAWGVRERFENRIQRDARALGAVRPPGTAASSALPEPVRRYVERCVPPSGPPPSVVRLSQRGEMRLKPDGSWTPFHATQHIAVGHVGFVWHAKLSMGGFVPTDAVDAYRRGEGRLEARLLGVLPMARAGGREIARAQALRYLAEIPWAPHATFANPELAWRALPDGAAEVGLTGSDRSATLRFDFDSSGDVVCVSGKRPRHERGRTEELPWVGEYSDHGTLGGVRIPLRAEVRWDTDPPYAYFRGRIVDLQLR